MPLLSAQVNDFKIGFHKHLYLSLTVPVCHHSHPNQGSYGCRLDLTQASGLINQPCKLCRITGRILARIFRNDVNPAKTVFLPCLPYCQDQSTFLPFLTAQLSLKVCSRSQQQSQTTHQTVLSSGQECCSDDNFLELLV